MATMTRDELAERLHFLKHEDWPRLSLDHFTTVSERYKDQIAAIRADPDIAAVVNRYLRDFVGGDCPACGYGRFSWGIVHGAGACACGWPGRLYHYIRDDRDLPDLVCSARCNGVAVCGAPRGAHLEHEVGWYAEGGRSGVEIELRCPAPTPPPGLNPKWFTSRWSAPILLDASMLLWAHPYTVHLRRP